MSRTPEYERIVVNEPEPGPPAESTLTRRRLLESGAAAGLVIASAGALGQAADAFAAAPKPRRGGTLRVGMLGGGDTETLDPNLGGANEIDIARKMQIFERLFTYDLNGSPVRQLAQDVSASNDLRKWTIKLVSDRHWHDGSALTADDVVHSFRFILNKNNKAFGYSNLSGVMTPGSIRRRDSRTVQIVLEQPNAELPTILSAHQLMIFKRGTTSFARPIGTGPFKFKSFTRGQRSVYVRNPDYPKHDGPYLDAVEFLSVTDATAKLNALIGGQVDAIDDIDPTTVRVIAGRPGLQVLRARGTNFVPMTMSVDMPPFTDPRVRQAFKLMTDRKQMVQQVQNGEGYVANDLFSPADPDFPRAGEIPQRPYDPEQAKSLLKQAGQSNLTVPLYTGAAGSGMVESATLFVNQAKLAGVTVTLDTVPGDQYWDVKYLKAPFAQSWWAGRPLVTQIQACLVSSSHDNETHWLQPAFDKLFADALTTKNATQRHEKFVTLQRMLWDNGGYIIWGFNNVLDGYAKRVHGLKASRIRWLGFYDFTDTYLS
jgi:peptide/nickel transport system substrate-binding protein